MPCENYSLFICRLVGPGFLVAIAQIIAKLHNFDSCVYLMFAATGHFSALGIQPVFTMSQMDNSVRQRAAAKGEHKCKCFGEFSLWMNLTHR